MSDNETAPDQGANVEGGVLDALVGEGKKYASLEELAKGKKLKEAAEYWVNGGSQDDTYDDAAVLGISMPKQKEEPVFEVWEDNWEVVMMFLRLQTQWNTTMGGFIGIKYEVLEWLCRLYSV